MRDLSVFSSIILLQLHQFDAVAKGVIDVDSVKPFERLIVCRFKACLCELVDQAVEESLRMEPAATLVDRYVTAETQLGDVVLRQGAAVSLSLAGANRDPAFFEHPDRFDLRRSNVGHHLAFVHGPHACIGMHLARLETVAALNAVLAVRDRAEIVDVARAQPRGLVFRKPEAIEVTFGARERNG